MSNLDSVNAENCLAIDKKIVPVNFFVDRSKEIKNLSEQLNSYNAASIVGLTGIGKTEMARKYALLNKDKYNVIWFFDSSLDLNEQFSELAKEINKTLLKNSALKISEGANNSQVEVMRFLSKNKDWLLVFDNLKLNENSKLKNIINWKHSGHIIICSQDAQDLPNIVYMHELDKKNSKRLMQKLLGNKKLDNELLEKLIGIFNGYPGLIMQGAMLIKEHSYLSLDEYKNILMKSSNPIKSHIEIVLTLLNEQDKGLLYQIALLNNQKFSKNLLKLLSNDQENIGSSLYNLSRFGFIKNTETEGSKSFFEMHDIVKLELLKLLEKQGEIKKILIHLIAKFNSLIPEGVTSRHEFIISDETIKSNLEVLLENAEVYGVNIFKILKLRKNLIDYYISSLDYYNVEKMKQWLDFKESKGIFDLNRMKEEQKSDYAWYVVDIGIYEDFAKAAYSSALSSYDKAENIIRNIHNLPELRSTILFQKAQTTIYGGDVKSAEENMELVDEVISKHKNADFDMGLYWFIKARIALANGNYEQAFIAIENNIEAEAHLPLDTFTVATFITKAEILNYMGNYNDSYKLIKTVSDKMKSDYSEHEVYARILTQLARAELGIGLLEQAQSHITKACDIFKKDIEKYNITTIFNTDYASALLVRGDVLMSNNSLSEALENYNKAEVIFFRRYGSNYYKVDEVLYLLSQGLKAACLNKSTFWKKHFYDQLTTYLDNDDIRVINACTFCSSINF